MKRRRFWASTTTTPPKEIVAKAKLGTLMRRKLSPTRQSAPPPN